MKVEVLSALPPGWTLLSPHRSRHGLISPLCSFWSGCVSSAIWAERKPCCECENTERRCLLNNNCRLWKHFHFDNYPHNYSHWRGSASLAVRPYRAVCYAYCRTYLAFVSPITSGSNAIFIRSPHSTASNYTLNLETVCLYKSLSANHGCSERTLCRIVDLIITFAQTVPQ